MNFQEILAELKKPFTPEDHKERKLPGGGRWFFIPWQRIKERLDTVYPEWQVNYSDPVITGDLIVIRCRLTIAGVCREGVGNSDAFKEKTSAGTYQFGSPVECAVADAFKNAAEAFGVAAYLDDQKFVAKYLKSKNDGRGELFAYGDQIRANRPPTQNKPFGAEPVKNSRPSVQNKPPATAPNVNSSPPVAAPTNSNPPTQDKPPATAPTEGKSNNFRDRVIFTAKQVGVDLKNLADLASKALGRKITKGEEIVSESDCIKVCQFILSAQTVRT